MGKRSEQAGTLILAKAFNMRIKVYEGYSDEQLLEAFESASKEVAEGGTILKYNLIKDEILKRMGVKK